MIDRRDTIQQEAKKAWWESSRKSTIIIGTGGGKSKVAVDLAKTLQPISILLLTNSENLRDKNWKVEFEKFGYPWRLIESECYQTACRWTNRKFDLVIADEVDFALSPVYSQFFLYNQYNYLIGLTGFCPPDKREQLESIAPVCYEVSTQDMQKEGTLNKSEFVIIEYPLSHARVIEQKLKKGGSFKTSENDQYNYWNKEFQKAIMIKSNFEKAHREGIGSPDDPAWKAVDWKFKAAAAKRKSVLNNLDSSVTVTKAILNHVLQDKRNKALVFSALTKQSSLLGIPTYHGTASDLVVDELNEGKIRALGLCKKLNRGTNLNGVNYMIKESFDGSETDFNQTHGRLMRLAPDQLAKYIILIPTYEAIVKNKITGVSSVVNLPTQAARWAEKMMNSFGDPTTRTIKIGRDYKLPQGITI